MRGMRTSLFVVAGAVALASGSWAALIGYDDASDPAYAGGWTNGSNGGFGFGPWQISATGANSGWFIGDSNGNGSGAGPGINTPVNRAWGMWANDSSGGSNPPGPGAVVASRRFANGPMNVGDTFSIDIDNGWIDNGRSVGFGLASPTGMWQFEFMFAGGGQFYLTNDSAGLVATTLGFTDGGLRTTFTKTGLFSYDFTATRLSDNVSITRSFTIRGITNNDSLIDSMYLWNLTAGFNSPRDFYANRMNLEAVPEPFTLALGAAGLAVAVRRRRR